MPPDLPDAHPTRIHRDDLVIELREPALVLRNQLRIERPGPIARDIQRHLRGSTQYRLLRRPVPPVAPLNPARPTKCAQTAPSSAHPAARRCQIAPSHHGQQANGPASPYHRHSVGPPCPKSMAKHKIQDTPDIGAADTKTGANHRSAAKRRQNTLTQVLRIGLPATMTDE